VIPAVDSIVTTMRSAEMERIIIAGSRNFSDKDFLFNSVDEVVKTINDEIEIVSGCCRGADVLGEQYANAHNIPVVRFPADWERYGRRAGYIRNKAMAEYAAGGTLIAFPVGKSIGTRMMIGLARDHGLKVVVKESSV